MQLKVAGPLTRFYKRTYFLEYDELPTNFCNFFWKLIFAFVVLPITALTYLVDGKNKKRPAIADAFKDRLVFPVIAVLLLLFLFTLIGAYVKLFVFVPIFTGSVTAIVVIAGLVILLGGEKRREAVGDFTLEALDVAVTKIENVKEGYCPKIEWK